VVVGKIGTATLSPEELVQSINGITKVTNAVEQLPNELAFNDAS